MTRDNFEFGIRTCLLVVIAHAIAYLTHEYSHAFVAWSLGWMANPLALDYGRPTLYNILFLGDVGDNVNYGPIFASGHGIVVAVIALSGLFFGNALLYVGLYQLVRAGKVVSNTIGISFIIGWL